MAMNRRTRSEWTDLIEEQKSSGLGQREWCEKHGIKPNTMREMARRIRKDAETAEKRPEWVEVVSVENDNRERAQAGSLLIEVGEYRLAVGSSYPAEMLATVLRGLSGC